MKKTTSLLIVSFAMAFFSSSSHADATFFTGDSLSSILNSMVQGDIDFPKRFGTSPQTPMDNPDITVSVRQSHLEKLVNAYMKQPIILGHDTGDNPSTINAEKIVVTPDPKRNVLQVFITGGILNLTKAYAGIEGKLVIKNAEFELHPDISKNDQKQVILKARVRLVALDIDQVAPIIDKGIANLLQNLYFTDQAIDAVNLTDYVSNIQGPEHMDIELASAVVLMTAGGIDIQTSWTVK